MALGLIKRLGELVDIRNDDLGLALTAEQTPKRARGAKARKAKSKTPENVSGGVDPGGAVF